MNSIISVIIPAYNAEKHINRCLQSVLKQTYSNLQILVINDGSNDNTAPIVKSIAEKDKRLILINKPHSGVADSRNIGLINSIGDYITFADSDDYLEPNMYDNMLRILKDNNADCAVCNVFFEKETGVFTFENNKKEFVLSPEDAEIQCLTKKSASVSVCNKIFKKSFIKKIKFPNTTLSEDSFFLHTFFSKNPKTVFTEQPFYHYNFCEDKALTLSPFAIKDLSAVYLFDNMIKDAADRKQNKLLPAIKLAKNEQLFKLALKCSMASASLKDSSILGFVMRDNLMNIIRNSPFKQKLFCFTFAFFPYLCILMAAYKYSKQK